MTSKPPPTPSLPRHIDKILQVRTGKAKPFYGLSTKSGIFKTPLSHPINLHSSGLEGDERVYLPHQSSEHALMQYAHQHYIFWRKELPQSAQLFEKGGFGENIVTEGMEMSEENVCIGDVYAFGMEAVVQVSGPRAPCFKLNHRFQVMDMSERTQDANKTGWYYRVLREGVLEAGDEIVLLERPNMAWTLIRVQWFLYQERKNVEIMRELVGIKELTQETREIFENRLQKGVFEEDSKRLNGGEEDKLKWNPYRIVVKRKETPRITSFVFEAVTPHEKATKVLPGSHIRVKLGQDGKLVRAYSVVSGDNNRFGLWTALEPESRGGSKYLHEQVKLGDTLPFSQMKSDFPLIEDADRFILIAGGIGITAFITSSRLLKEQNSKFELHYAVQSTADIAFSNYLKNLGDRVKILDKSMGQRMDMLNIVRDANDRAHIYVCGPERMLEGVKQAATTLNFPQSNIHSEAFSTSTSGDPFTAELATSGKVLEIKEHETLLDVLRDAGLDIGSSCEVGNCGTCKAGVLKGRVEHRGTGLQDEEKQGAMLSCVSRGIGKIVLDL